MKNDPPFCVLLVEDDAVNQDLAQLLLKKWKYRVIVAANGIEALAQVKETPMNIILMDLQMPQMDGFQVTAVIRREEVASGRHLPIIGMTAHAGRGDRERCLGAALDDHLAKPIRPKELKRLLEPLHLASGRPVLQKAYAVSETPGPACGKCRKPAAAGASKRAVLHIMQQGRTGD